MAQLSLAISSVVMILGGVGLYGSTKDYLTFLRHLLLVKGEQGTVALS